MAFDFWLLCFTTDTLRRRLTTPTSSLIRFTRMTAAVFGFTSGRRCTIRAWHLLHLREGLVEGTIWLMCWYEGNKGIPLEGHAGCTYSEDFGQAYTIPMWWMRWSRGHTSRYLSVWKERKACVQRPCSDTNKRYSEAHTSPREK